MRQEQEPATLRVDEVGPGVLRVQLPLDIPGLGHVNTYLFPDRRGVAVVDPGMAWRKSRKALIHRLGLAGLRVSDIHTVLITHSHPDHFGAAAWLAEEAGAEVVTHAAFRLPWMADDCDAHIHDVDPDDATEGNPHEGPTPWGGPQFRPKLRHRLRRRPAHPRPARRVRHGDVVRLADREWVAVHTPGHTLDHLCLADVDNGLLISGDHLLPTITPHISGLGTGRDPLASFMASLDRILDLGSVHTALPAHGHPFDGLGERVNALKRHHGRRLDALRRALSPGREATVGELTAELFPAPHVSPLAESEVYAHLQHLCRQGVVHERRHGDVLLYRAMSEPPDG